MRACDHCVLVAHIKTIGEMRPNSFGQLCMEPGVIREHKFAWVGPSEKIVRSKMNERIGHLQMRYDTIVVESEELVTLNGLIIEV